MSKMPPTDEFLGRRRFQEPRYRSIKYLSDRETTLKNHVFQKTALEHAYDPKIRL